MVKLARREGKERCGVEERARRTKEENKRSLKEEKGDKGGKERKLGNIYYFYKKNAQFSQLSQGLGLIRHQLLQPPRKARWETDTQCKTTGAWVSDRHRPQQWATWNY